MPTVVDGDALAVRPPRVNIFAKPDAPPDRSDRATQRPGGVFDETAACTPTGCVAVVRGAGRRTLAPALRRLACLAGASVAAVGLAAALAAWSRDESAPPVPAAPVAQHPRQPDASHATRRRVPRRRPAERRRPHRHHKVARPPQAPPTASGAPRPLRPARAATAPPPAQPNPGRRQPGPLRRLPARVAPDAPPEFM
jgi:hypothetical protein